MKLINWSMYALIVLLILTFAMTPWLQPGPTLLIGMILIVIICLLPPSLAILQFVLYMEKMKKVGIQVTDIAFNEVFGLLVMTVMLAISVLMLVHTAINVLVLLLIFFFYDNTLTIADLKPLALLLFWMVMVRFVTKRLTTLWKESFPEIQQHPALRIK